MRPLLYVVLTLTLLLAGCAPAARRNCRVVANGRPMRGATTHADAIERARALAEHFPRNSYGWTCDDSSGRLVSVGQLRRGR